MSDGVFATERDRVWKSLLEQTVVSDDRDKQLFDPYDAQVTSCVTGGNHDYEALTLERLAKLNAQFAAMRSGKAYLVCPPEFVNALVDFPTVQFESPPLDGIQFRMYQDFNVRLINKHLGIPISMLQADIGGSDPVYVPRPAVDEPESPSMFQWCIIVVVLIGLLCAMAGAL